MAKRFKLGKAALEIGADNLVKGYKSLKIGEEIPFELSLNKSQYSSGDFKDEIQIADSGYGQGQILLNPVQIHVSLLRQISPSEVWDFRSFPEQYRL